MRGEFVVYSTCPALQTDSSLQVYLWLATKRLFEGTCFVWPYFWTWEIFICTCWLIFVQACSQGSESSFRTSLAKFHVSILGQFFLFYKHIAYLKNPADRPMTFMSWFYSDQSTPTYWSCTILLLSVLATFYENSTHFKRRWRNRSYPDNLLENTSSEIKFSERMSALQNKLTKNAQKDFAVCYRISPICA